MYMINSKNIKNVKNKFWNYSLRESTAAHWNRDSRVSCHWRSILGLTYEREKIMFYRSSSRQYFLRYVESFEKKTVALITMDDNGGLPIKCSATRAVSRVTHGSSRFRKYSRAARPVSANERSYSRSAESCKSADAIRQGGPQRQVLSSEINNDNKMCNFLRLERIEYPGGRSFNASLYM